MGKADRPPKWVKPQLTRLVEEAPSGDAWVHEIKYDGYRMHARIDGGKATLLTRTGLDWSYRYRRTVEALQRLPVKSAYLDGELCALNADGVPVFSRLQAAIDEGHTDQLVFFTFDLLFLNGDNIAPLPLVERKARLKRLFRKKLDGLLYSEHVVGDGPQFRVVAGPSDLSALPRRRARHHITACATTPAKGLQATPEQDGPSKAVDPNTAFALEQHFPNAADLLVPYSLKSYDEAVVTIDANALLLPYGMGNDDLSAIADVYRKLAKEHRLFVSARAIREFVRHRDEKLAAMISALNDKLSRIDIPPDTLSFVLDSLPAYQQLKAAHKKMREGRNEYGKATQGIIAKIRAWRGDDPVSALYREVFTKENIIEHQGNDKEITTEWEQRQRNRRPPGYKDASKLDSGIGDFLIWKSILRVGETKQRHHVFVTGEEKPDWFVRASGSPIYPRPELVDEYRRASNGCNLWLSTLADLLAAFKAPAAVVDEVRKAETNARERFAFGKLPRRSFVWSRNDKQRPMLYHPDVRIMYFPNAGTMNFDDIENIMKEFPVKPVRREEKEQDLFLYYDAAE